MNSGSLSIEDAAIIARARTAYRLLGQKLPGSDVKRALLKPDAKPRIDSDYGMATVLMLFPDWCQSCSEQTKTLTEFARLNTETKIHAYALVFHDDFGVPESKPVETDWKDLEGTSTLVVGAEAARNLGAIDFPLGVVVDQDGIVRFVGPLPENAFQGNGCVARILQRVANHHLVEEQLRKAMQPAQ
ncbi:hypothetical protein ACOBR2_05570 [Telmatobacter bradus]|uniref:hypothetical protein n=1 Tax=Telmatobacter bradus TaxID=474953 RepID=UPI003B432679